MGVWKYLPNCWKMALKWQFTLLSSSKNHSHCACHAHQRPTHSQCLESWTRQVSDFVPIASLLEWQWRRIVMRSGQFYHSSRNGASRTAQCREIPHSFPEPFYQVLQARVGDPTPTPPSPPRRFRQKLDQVQQILERPSEGGRLHPSADAKLS